MTYIPPCSYYSTALLHNWWCALHAEGQADQHNSKIMQFKDEDMVLDIQKCFTNAILNVQNNDDDNKTDNEVTSDINNGNDDYDGNGK